MGYVSLSLRDSFRFVFALELLKGHVSIHEPGLHNFWVVSVSDARLLLLPAPLLDNLIGVIVTSSVKPSTEEFLGLLTLFVPVLDHLIGMVVASSIEPSSKKFLCFLLKLVRVEISLFVKPASKKLLDFVTCILSLLHDFISVIFSSLVEPATEVGELSWCLVEGTKVEHLVKVLSLVAHLREIRLDLGERLAEAHTINECVFRDERNDLFFGLHVHFGS